MPTSQAESVNSNPYASLVETSQWTIIDRAIQELAENRDLVETTAHEYIVGYLCKALVDTSAVTAHPQTAAKATTKDTPATAETCGQILREARAAIHAANPTGRDLVKELIEERRREAERE